MHAVLHALMNADLGGVCDCVYITLLNVKGGGVAQW